MIKSGGSNVSPAEVESVLSAIVGVRECYVFGVAAGDRGEDVAAVVVLEPDAKLDQDQLRGEARAALSSYKVPRQWQLVRPERLPMLPTGKVDLAALRSRFAEPPAG
jgi:fatty-acyl-CoA synthase